MGDLCIKDQKNGLVSEKSTIIELNFDLESHIQLILLRKSKVFKNSSKSFTISFETIKTDFKETSPAGISVKIYLKGELLSKSSTKIETSFCVEHEPSFMRTSYEEPLFKIFSESLSNISKFLYEQTCQDKLARMSSIREIIKAEENYEIHRKEEKHKLNKLNTLANEATAASTEDVKLEIEEETKNSHIVKYNLNTNYDRETMKVDDLWLKWCEERLDSEERKIEFRELQDRIHNKHGLTEMSESAIIRFYHGMDYILDETEEKIVEHVKFMGE
mmetsp:Transcript_6220/g.5340  ORF Transcript_6220/g.5340 Transcript_6220/m.5340 type:complete len:275 (-) Transcript_6220:550-1374(-)